MNWDALSAISEAAGVIVAIIAIYLGFKKSPQIAERVGQALQDQKKLAEAVAQADESQGNRDVLLEHKVDAYTVIRNRATIDKDGRIVKLYAHKGPWQVGQRLSPSDYKVIDQ